MLSVILPRWAEPTVIHLTQENLQRELEAVNGAELLVTDSWSEGIAKTRNDYICLVEPDCLVSSGYFASMMGLFTKSHFRKLSIMSATTSVLDWENRFYGYQVGNNYSDGVWPVLKSKSTSPYPVQIAYVPGSILRMSMLNKIMPNVDFQAKNLTKLSTDVSLECWRNNGHVLINPNSSYCTTEDHVSQQGKFDPKAGDLVTRFAKEVI